MASKQQASKGINVICDCCGSTIVPTEAPIPTAYVWYNGKSICWDCIKKGATNTTATAPKKALAPEK